MCSRIVSDNVRIFTQTPLAFFRLSHVGRPFPASFASVASRVSLWSQAFPILRRTGVTVRLVTTKTSRSSSWRPPRWRNFLSFFFEIMVKYQKMDFIKNILSKKFYRFYSILLFHTLGKIIKNRGEKWPPQSTN